MPEPKAGIKSTEFWVTGIVVVVPQIMAWVEKVAPDTALLISGIAGIVYAISRAFVKKGAA